MLKQAIVLCLVVCSWTSNGSVWSDPVRTTQLMAQEVLNTTFFKIHENFKTAQESNAEIARNLTSVAIQVGQQTWEKMSAVNQQISSTVHELSSRAQHVNTSECYRYSDHLLGTSRAVILTTGMCVLDRLKTAFDYIMGIDKLFIDEFAKLTVIEEEVQLCIDKINDVKSAVAGMLCTKASADKAKRISGKFTKVLDDNAALLKFLLQMFQPYLTHCMANSGLKDFTEESSTIISSTYACIQQKASEARKAERRQYMP